MVLLKVITVAVALNMPDIGNDGPVVTIVHIPYKTVEKCEKRSQALESTRESLKKVGINLYSTECFENEEEWREFPL